MDWEDLFDEEVVNRGYGYYVERRVKNFQMTNKLITAQVIGTHQYDVEIHISNNHIEEMKCDCYYGEKCKHIAAVFHYLDDHYAGITTDTSELCNYKRKVDETIQYFSDSDGFISYYAARDFIGNIQNILSDDVGTFMDNSEYDGAFELTAYIFSRVNDVDMDDSAGGKIDIADECVQIWEEIIIYANESLMNMMSQWMENYIEMSYSDFNDYVERLLVEYFW